MFTPLTSLCKEISNRRLAIRCADILECTQDIIKNVELKQRTPASVSFPFFLNSEVSNLHSHFCDNSSTKGCLVDS